MVTVTIKVVEPAENHDEVRPQIVTIKVDRYDQAAPIITIKAQLSRSRWLIKQVGTGSYLCCEASCDRARVTRVSERRLRQRFLLLLSTCLSYSMRTRNS